MKQKDFLIILIPALILTILWVVFSIYHNYVTSTIKDPLTFQTIPIDGKFDKLTIENIKTRQRVDPLYELLTLPSTDSSTNDEEIIDTQETTTTTEEITPTPTDTQEPTPSPTEEITPTEDVILDEGLTE